MDWESPSMFEGNRYGRMVRPVAARASRSTAVRGRLGAGRPPVGRVLQAGFQMPAEWQWPGGALPADEQALDGAALPEEDDFASAIAEQVAAAYGSFEDAWEEAPWEKALAVRKREGGCGSGCGECPCKGGATALRPGAVPQPRTTPWEAYGAVLAPQVRSVIGPAPTFGEAVQVGFGVGVGLVAVGCLAALAARALNAM